MIFGANNHHDSSAKDLRTANSSRAAFFWLEPLTSPSQKPTRIYRRATFSIGGSLAGRLRWARRLMSCGHLGFPPRSEAERRLNSRRLTQANTDYADSADLHFDQTLRHPSNRRGACRRLRRSACQRRGPATSAHTSQHRLHGFRRSTVCSDSAPSVESAWRLSTPAEGLRASAAAPHLSSHKPTPITRIPQIYSLIRPAPCVESAWRLSTPAGSACQRRGPLTSAHTSQHGLHGFRRSTF
jgi:hypothetical protein